MSKNIFADLGFNESEAAGLKMKSYLVMALQDAIKNSGKKQVEVASIIGTDQAKVSKILAGKIDEFSIERITEYMQKLGYDIHIGTSPAPGDRQGTIVMDKRELTSTR